MKKHTLKWFIVELLKDFFKIIAGGIGAYYFMNAAQTQNWFICGACIVLFFALFWAIFFERIETDSQKRRQK